MNTINRTVTPCVVVEEEVQFTLVELSRACRTDVDQLVALVMEGVLTPSGEAPERWRFGGTTLRRARVALRLTRDLELNAASTALVLDLLDEIDALRSRLRRLGGD
ncbi:chaperone modulator CbpM [Thiocystis violacea]|uniref:chaperone modulator CbpM n=1 Tax=Thiocystis violacea TaxID=13725 RepID=UPI00190552D7|nr:chaperone modulator CbpM [Thiocystis violacea]MBK1724362.1 hypothetical protein [Thiocystis violacea]